MSSASATVLALSVDGKSFSFVHQSFTVGAVEADGLAGVDSAPESLLALVEEPASAEADIEELELASADVVSSDEPQPARARAARAAAALSERPRERPDERRRDKVIPPRWCGAAPVLLRWCVRRGL